jgi:hypothetical protein
VSAKARKSAKVAKALRQARRCKDAGNGTPNPTEQPKLLSGDNPQIAKGYGDAPVKAYIAAMLGWKQGVGRRLDALIEHAVPCKAVRWNSPFFLPRPLAAPCPARRVQAKGRALPRHP